MHCCLFSLEKVNNGDIDLEVVEDFGEAYQDENGEIVHFFHTWDDGNRELVRCKKCGALLLRQWSEFHGIEDAYYTDLFPVKSREEALVFNKEFSGWAIEKEYKSEWLCSTNDGWAIKNRFSQTGG